MGRWMGKHYISTKNKYNYGASTFFEIDIDKYTENNIFELLENVIPEKDNREPAKELRKRKIQSLLRMGDAGMNYSYGPFSELRQFSMRIIPYPRHAINAHHFEYNSSSIFLNFPSDVDDIPLREKLPLGGFDKSYLEKIKFYMEMMEKVFNHFQCEFGWGDNFDYQLKFEGKDPRKEIFGVNYYGRKMVEQIGREKILSLQDCIVKEMPWGGMIVQLAENPYVDIKDELRIKIKNAIWGA